MAQVAVEEAVVASINEGLLIFVGIEENDTLIDIDWLSTKIISLRIFNDSSGLMNLSIQETKGEILVVSQFTLHASTKKGNRPSFIRAAKPIHAIEIYNTFISQLENVFDKTIARGVFGANMEVSLINDGPVTLFIDTKNKE